MAKFAWASDGRKYNISYVDKFEIDTYSVANRAVVRGFIPGKGSVSFRECNSNEDAVKFIDEITASDVDKIAFPFMAVFAKYIESIIPGVKGNA